MDEVASYSSYRPHGETVNLVLDFEDPTPELLFSHALKVRHCLADVLRPCGFNLWLACALEETGIPVDDPEPSQPFWQVREQDSPSAGNHIVPAGLPFEIRLTPQLSDDALTGVFRDAMRAANCGSGFVATFEQLAPTITLTRIVDHSDTGPDGSVPIAVFDQVLTYPTVSVDGGFWLDAPPTDATYLPPVTFAVAFDGIMTTSLSVHWSRWLDQGTGEHQALTAALKSMTEIGWRLHGPSLVFDL